VVRERPFLFSVNREMAKLFFEKSYLNSPFTTLYYNEQLYEKVNLICTLCEIKTMMMMMTTTTTTMMMVMMMMMIMMMMMMMMMMTVMMMSVFL